MRVDARQLSTHVSRGLAPIYLVSGDEPLLVAEAVDTIRAEARRRGFDQRELLIVERNFKWAELEGSVDNLSLFASRRLLELRMASPRPGDAGSKILQNLAGRPDPDCLIIVTTSKLDSSAARSSWVKAIEAAGVLVQVWPVERAELPGWLRRRAGSLGLELTPAAAELLADRVEGNLLAGDQELRKLAILGGDGSIDEEAVAAAVASNARFDVFRLVDALLTGDAGRAFNILDGLRAEGAEPALVSWALSRELALLAQLDACTRQGQRIDGAFAKRGVWQRRQPLVRRALGRYASEDLARLLRHAATVDRVVKGARFGNPWQAITQLVLLVLDPCRLRDEVA
ncbi:MAG TPA: DNA polymerase III subunit delta [Gammaproteobacteria bacterium]|nr:DNA polymerase III subunit delta [Gammaproteobacteria bacterium]